MKECPKCGNIHKKNGKFCSRSCANSRTWTKEDKLKKSISAKKSKKVLEANRDPQKREHLSKTLTEKHKNGEICIDYLHTEEVREKIRQTYRSKTKWWLSKLDIQKKKNYRKACQFRFSLNDYPDEFNFGLIEEYGWYKAKNKGDNPNGVSRDHTYSIHEGFKNNIDPYYISHPANCKLLCHSDNNTKDTKSAITIDELKKKVKKWNEKYGE